MGQAIGPIFTIAGTVVGAYFGGPVGAGIGGAIGSMVGGVASSFLNRPHPLISDLQTGNASYGNPIPVLYGTARLSGTMLWQSKVKASSSSTGKGGGGSSVTHYHQSAAFGFCEGPAILVKIWLDGKLFWSSANRTQEFTSHTFQFRDHPGDEAQLPDPLIAQWVRDNVVTGDNACPAYRGLSYLVCEGVDLINYGNRFPQVTAEWTATGHRNVLADPLAPWSVDTTSYTPPYAGFNEGVAVDWTSSIVYTHSGTDGTVRVFSITSGTQVASASAASLSPDGVAPEFPIAGGVATTDGAHFVYIYNSRLPAATNYYIQALDKNTLKPAAPPMLMGPEPYWIFPVTGQVGELNVRYIVAPDGSRDFLIGVGGYGNIFVCPVLLGGDIEQPIWAPVHFENLVRYTHIIGGDWDLLDDGTHRVYVLHSSFYGDGLYLYSFLTDGTFIAQQTLIGVMMPSTFGYADGAAGTNSFYTTNAYFDSTDGTIIMAIRQDTHIPGDTVVKIDPDKLQAGEPPVIWQNIVPGSGLSNTFTFQGVTNIASGTIAFPSAGATSFALMDTASGQYTTIANTSGVGLGTGAYSYDATREALVMTGFATVSGVGTTLIPHVVYLRHVTTDLVSVADIIADLCFRVGLGEDMIDVSAVTSTCVGYVVRDIRSAAAAIADLCHTFQIDMVESDYTLKFVPRGQAPVATIAQAALAPIEANNPGIFWSAKPAQEQELPLEVILKYIDPALDYQPGSTYAKRIALPVPTMFSKRRTTFDVPVIVDALSARHIAESILYTLWAERTAYQAALGQQYLWLDPTDNVTVTLTNQTLTARIEQIQIGADFSLQLALASEDISVYVPSNSPAATPGIGAQTVPITTSSDLMLFNIPLLRDIDATSGSTGRIYFAAAAQNPTGFDAATVYHSTDAVNYPVEGIINAGAAWGRTTEALGDTTMPFATDYLNTIRISLQAGSPLPTSISYAELMNDGNPALIGLELIQYQTVTDNDDGTFTLSVLLRGRRGTDWATSSHTASERVVLLSTATVGTGLLTLSDINRPEFYKLVTASTTLANTNPATFNYLGFDLMPYSPVNVRGVYVGDDIVLGWSRRSRIGGLLADGTDTVPLGETVEAYEVDILEAGAVIRTLFPLSSPAATYSAAQIAADWTDPPAELQVRVYQMSTAVGRGFSRLWTLDLSGTSASSSSGDTTGTGGGTTSGGTGGSGTPTLPGLITSLRSTTQTIGTISLAWTLPTDGGALDAVIVGYRLHGSSGAYTLLTLGASATVATVSALTSATAYDFEVYGRNAAGSSAPALLSNISTQATTVVLPGAITSLHSTAQTSGSITVAWTLPGSGGPIAAVLLGYRLHSSGGAYTLITLAATATSAVVSGLAASTSYDFEAYARNAAGSSTAATLASVSTDAATTGGGGGSGGNGIYVLSDVVPSAIAAAPVQYKVVEATSDGSGAFWSSTDVTTMKSGGGKVFGYFDCGWCEDYRPYYATAVAAGILGTHPDPEWPAEFSVAFWTTDWHNIAFDWCDSLMAAGFNGIYLDVVDAWGDAWAQAHVPGGGATNSANAMIALVAAIRAHAHATDPSFEVWVNGGEELFAYSAPSWLDSLDGMYKEQVCYNETSAAGPTSSGDRSAEFTMLANCTGGGKPVVLIEYVTGAGPIADVKAVCAAQGYGYYIAAIDLGLSGVDTEGF